MWFIKALGEFDTGEQFPIYADLGYNYLCGTSFFAYFDKIPVYTTYDLMLSTEPKEKLKVEGLKDILNAIIKEAETEEDLSDT